VAIHGQRDGGAVGSDLARAPSSVNIVLRIVQWVTCGRRTVAVELVRVQDKGALLARRFQCFGRVIAQSSRLRCIARMVDCCGDVGTVSFGSGLSTYRLGTCVASGKQGCEL